MISVIIPTLNEAEHVPATVRLLRQRQAGPEVEVLVADGDPSDGRSECVAELGCTVVRQASCRAVGMNRGAAVARGCAGGAFDFIGSSWSKTRGVERELLRVVRLRNRIRFRWTGHFDGDQGIFVRRDVFVRLGGFPEVPLGEDGRYCQGRKREGRLVTRQPPIRTLPRRFLAREVARQFLADLRLVACESCGLKPRRAWSSYNRLKRQGHPSPVI